MKLLQIIDQAGAAWINPEQICCVESDSDEGTVTVSFIDAQLVFTMTFGDFMEQFQRTDRTVVC